MNWIKHLRVVTAHRHMVIRHCCKAGISLQGLTHDLSKFSPTEFGNGVRYFQGYRSPNEKEREVKGYSEAWMHHKGRNRHHFEYWTDYSPRSKQVEPVVIPLRFLAEMFCDRVAASKIYNKEHYTSRHPLDYFTREKHRLVIHPQSARQLEDWLQMLAEQGEEETFAHIKKAVKESRL